MSKTKTAAELLAIAEAAEKKAAEARKRATEAAKAEKAKTNALIIKSIERWQNRLSPEDRTPWEELPEIFEGLTGKLGTSSYDWYDEYQRKTAELEQATEDLEKIKDDVMTRIRPKYEEMEADLGKWQEAAERYGISQQELLDYILTDKQVRYYKSNHRFAAQISPTTEE